MKKVLLVNTNTERFPYPAPPIGVCLVAASIEKDYNVEIFDGTFRNAQGLRDILNDFRPDFVGVGIRNIDDLVMEGGCYYLDAIIADFAGAIREGSSAKIILGGCGFSLFPTELLGLFDADYGIIGEAEESFPALLEALDRGMDPESIPGVCRRTEKGITLGPRPLKPPGRISIRFSRIDLKLDYSPYRERGAYPIQTRRGCIHQCLYCTYPYIEGKTFRLRSPDDVVDEIEETTDRLEKVMFEFVDSTFSNPADHAAAICREIIRRKLDVRLRTMGINPGDVSEDLLKLMKDAGFTEIDCTIDSASPSMLRSLRKGFTRKELERAGNLIRDLEIPTKWYFVIGGPGETEETVRESLDFIEKFVYEEDMVYLSEGLRIYPGTDLHGVAVRDGLVGPSESLVRPKFYVSPALGQERLGGMIRRITSDMSNCFRCGETTPSRAMLEAALKMRREENLDEPMFRTLMRLHRRGFR